MIRFLLPFFVFLFFIIEGTVVQVFSPQQFGSDVIFVPRFVMIIIVFISIFLGRGPGVLYGMSFGLLYDIIYADVIGVYLFSMGFLGYILAFTYKPFQLSLFLLVVTSLMGVIGLEFFVYGLYSIVGLTGLVQESFINERLLPALIFNGVFVILIAYPLRKFLLFLLVIKLREQQQEEN